jgi:hypothetical protein
MNIYRTLRSLRDHERGIKPDAAWIRATRATLLMQVKNAMPTAEVAAKYRVPVLSHLYERIVRALRGPVLATTSIVGVVLGGSIASVSAAENALPGDTLYSVKLVTEQARLAFVGRTDKVKLKAAFTKRRVEELKAIVTSDDQKKDERAAIATEVLKRDLDTLKQQMTNVQNDGGTDAVDAAKEVDKSTVEVAKGLAEAKDALSLDVQEKVTDAQQQAADVGIQALEVMVSAKTEDGGDAVSQEDLTSSLAAHAEVAAKSLATVNALPPEGTSVSTSTLQLAQDTAQVLATVQQLVGEQKMTEAVGALKDATAKSLTLQKQTQQDVLTNAATSSTSAIPPVSDASATSTPSNIPTTSSTKPIITTKPTSTSTPSTTSTST